MNLKLFYSPPKWLAFEAPEKPMKENYATYLEYYPDLFKYEKAYAEAKANALEVFVTYHLAKEFRELVGYENEKKDGESKVYDWPYKSEVREGKYYLEI